MTHLIAPATEPIHDVEELSTERLPDGRVEATVTKGRLTGSKVIFICTPPSAAYFS